MKKKLNLGYSDFMNIIKNGNYFVDKTLLIKEILDAEKAVLLFPRPRRFGKTLNLSMLRYFFDITMPENKSLFKGLNIWNEKEIIEKHCCKYPVIYMTFKDAKAETWEETFANIKTEIASTYKQHYYLLQSNAIFDFEKEYFEKILKKTAETSDYDYSIKLLSEFLYKHYKQNVVILIDEYDTPIQSGYKKFYTEVISFMRNLLSGAYKDNSYLYKGVITGILRVSKESIFSGLNNLSVNSILNISFADKFGFTEAEVLQILKDFDVKTDYEQIKKWYNGYKFGKTESIYNPWSILNYVSAAEEGFRPYWTQTSANELIREQIAKQNAKDVRSEIFKLINGETIVKDIEENFVFMDLDEDIDLLWTLLLFSGYLTIEKAVSRKSYELRIPNYELKFVFQDTILDWLKRNVKIRKRLLETTANHLVNNELYDFEKGFKQIIGDTFSYYDTVKKHEYVYQAYVLGMLAIIGDDYIIKSNKESGEGRYDIMLIPHEKTRNGVVIEIKRIRKQKPDENDQDFINRINKHLEQARQQIDKNKYYKELIDYGISPENIVKVPIVFVGKEPYITEAKLKDDEDFDWDF